MHGKTSTYDPKSAREGKKLLKELAKREDKSIKTAF
jgi:hypothetical protein